MVLEIRTAALDEDLEQRLRMAVARLRVFHARGRVADWDGTRCDLLVAAGEDAYGFKVMQLARQRGVPVIAIGEPLESIGVEVLASDCTTASLAQLIRAYLNVRPVAPPRPRLKRPAIGEACCEAAICRLAGSDLRGHAIDASRNGRVLMLRPKTGRIYAASHSDLLAGIEGFLDPGWEMSIVDQTADVVDAASASLESFLLRAAYHGKDQFRDFPAGRYRLEAWPDLGALPSLLSALHIAKELVGGSVSPEELYSSSHPGTARANVNACLWALAAANLLIDTASDQVPEVVEAPPILRRMERGLWTRLAQRFGLLAQ